MSQLEAFNFFCGIEVFTDVIDSKWVVIFSNALRSCNVFNIPTEDDLYGASLRKLEARNVH
jgi:hypothetical protein